MRLKLHDLFFHALCTGLVLIALIVGFLAMKGVVPAYAQSGGCFKTVDVMALLRRDDIPFDVFQDTDGIARGVAIIGERSSLPIGEGADAIIIVDYRGTPQIAVSFRGLICGRIAVSEPFVRDLKAAILGRVQGRDA